MLTVTKDFEFCASHSLPGHKKCGQVHGHNYLVRVTFKGKDGEQMVVDLGVIKEQVKPLINQLDHFHLNSIRSNIYVDQNNPFIKLMECYPSAENIAKFIYEEIKMKCSKELANKLYSIEIFETPNSSIKYIPEEE